jgi:hypothetical protein
MVAAAMQLELHGCRSHAVLSRERSQHTARDCARIAEDH